MKGQIAKYISFGTMAIMVIVLVCATVAEKFLGTQAVMEHVYSSPVFVILWGVAAISALLWLLRCRMMRRPATMMIHLSFMLILAGGLLTWFTARYGTMHLREGNAPQDAFVMDDGKAVHLPFSLSLDDFEVEYYPGTGTPKDFRSRLVVDYGSGNGAGRDDADSGITGLGGSPGDGRQEVCVSMNRIFSCKGFRFYQSSYDEDEAGTVLSVSHDPYGIAVTYSGYALLLLSILLFFLQRDSGFRKALKRLSSTAMAIVLMLSFSSAANAADGMASSGKSVATVGIAEERSDGSSDLRKGYGLQVRDNRREIRGSSAGSRPGRTGSRCGRTAAMPKALPAETAAEFGSLYVYYNGRIAPMQTLARDFTMKLYGRTSYRGLSAEQVLTGWMFYYDSWLKTGFLTAKDRKKPAKADDKYEAIRLVCSAEILKIFPYLEGTCQHDVGDFPDEKGLQTQDFPDKNGLQATGNQDFQDSKKPQALIWYSPSGNIPVELPADEWMFVRRVMSLAGESVALGRFSETKEIFSKIRSYQVKTAGDLLPSEKILKAERLYNHIGRPMPAAMICVTLGFILFILMSVLLASGKQAFSADGFRHTLSSGFSFRGGRRIAMQKLFFIVTDVAGAAVFVYLTAALALRWVASGHVPMSNGFETMMMLGWITMLITFILSRRFSIVRPFGFLLCGFSLLVASIGEKDPQITHLMPVLSSPLLSLHVASMMISYSLLGLLALNGIMGVTVNFIHRHRSRQMASGDSPPAESQDVKTDMADGLEAAFTETNDSKGSNQADHLSQETARPKTEGMLSRTSEDSLPAEPQDGQTDMADGLEAAFTETNDSKGSNQADQLSQEAARPKTEGMLSRTSGDSLPAEPLDGQADMADGLEAAFTETNDSKGSNQADHLSQETARPKTECMLSRTSENSLAVRRLHDIGLVILYPALFTLTIGIFLGAVWANISWGRYWGWDPKEVWALITMIVYASALHCNSLKSFRAPVFFHRFCILAFLCVLITYFGVNLVLGGLHGYA